METAKKGKAKRRHLSVSECSSLAQSESGSQSITQPFNLNLSGQCQGLQPRTTTKRRKKESDGRQQRGIAEFFSSTGVLSSSPQKNKINGVVKTEIGTNGHTVPKEEDVEEEEMSNYMDGITEDMFKDEEFETSLCCVRQHEVLQEERMAGCSSWTNSSSFAFRVGHSNVALKKEEEEVQYDVESLPDAHYGLLGIKKNLQEPQGQFEDLPEEVLSVILAHLPAVDLFCNISLVCHQWKDIVMDPKFLPWKKLYCRYEKQEKIAVMEIMTTLKDNSIVSTDDLCLLNMIRYMSQFKHNRRVNVMDVLSCIKGHHLYSQAKACIKHRLPDIDTFDGEPNPWSAMALMIILADGVKDILNLVYRLQTSGCLMTPDGISEFLWAIATLLLAMRNTNITISNRWHYNVFYVLHLMENAPPPSSQDSVGRERQLHITHEQQQILNHDIHKDHIVKIMAFAGTGKTTTLVKYAQQRPDLRLLYIAFNKSVSTQANRSFPANVECRTIHSIAYNAIGKKYSQLKKLSSNLKPFTIASVLPKGLGGFVNAKVVSLTLNHFWSSTDDVIDTQHVPNRYVNTNGREEHPTEAKKRDFVHEAQKIWKEMTKLKPTKQSAYHMTHDGYLKLWQLQRPVLCGYDVIFIDEAQDCTPVIMDILLPQNCGKILVGDPHQQIYSFRGAVNALHAVPHTHLYYLTQSFRFGAEIAYVGATILDVCKKVKKQLVGGLQDGTVRGENIETLESLRLAHEQVKGNVAILCRSNVTVFSEAVRLTDANPNCKIHIVGGVENFGLRKIFDIWILMQPENKRITDNLWIKDPFIRSFSKGSLSGYAGLKRYATQMEDAELAAKLSIVQTYNTRIPELVERIGKCTCSLPNSADYILGTVHKAKGLEFDTVVVSGDFIKVPCSRHNLQRINFNPGIRNTDGDEWNLLYVAVTRAKRSLYITKSISNVLTLAGEYFLRTELSSTLLNNDQSRKCTTRECPNQITKEMPLSMHRLPIRYMDSAEMGGVLCATCVEQRIGPMAFLLSPPDSIKAMHYTEERLELPINISMLLALL